MSLAVKFYDVEHGNCTHVITPNRKHLLYDLGSKAHSSISLYLKNKYFRNSGKPDMLAISHPHIDHISDLGNMYLYGITPYYLWRDKQAFPLIITASDSQHHINIKNHAT